MSVRKNKSTGKQKAKASLYRTLGIRWLNKAIMATIGRFVLKVNPREKMPSYFVGHPFEINSLELTKNWLAFNEAVHLILIVICLAIGYFFLEKGYISGVAIIIFVILLNIWLCLMQRMNRNRIRQITTQLKKRQPLPCRTAAS